MVKIDWRTSLLIFIKISEDNTVYDQHFKPFDEKYGLNMTEEELLQIGFLVDHVPEPEKIEGKIAITKYDKETGFYFEYVDEPVIQKPEDKIAEMAEQLKQTQKDLGNVLLESANDKAKISELEGTVGSLLLEVAALKSNGDVA